MTRRHGLAIVLAGAACAPLAIACGVSEGGLGSAGIDSGPQGGGEAGQEQETGLDFPDGTTSGADADAAEPGEGATPDDAADVVSPDDAAQGDATTGDGGLTDGGDGSSIESGVADAEGEAGPHKDAGTEAGGTPDGGPDAASDAGSVLDSGGNDATSAADSAVDSGSADGSHDAGSPDTGTTCDFAGTWGSRLVIDVSWTPQGITGIILASGSGTITQWILSTITLNGTSSTASTVVCGIDLPDFDGTAIAGGEVYGIRFPNSLFDSSSLPAFSIDGTFSGSTPGATYNTSAAAVLLGLTLTNPTTAPWPATITTEVDEDQDGNPGVTANALHGNGYTYPPVDLFKTNRASELYLAIRQVTQISAQATDCNDISGTVSIPTITDTGTGTSKPAIDSHVIGCLVSGTTTACNSTQTSFVDNTQPVFTPSGGSSFTSVRMATGATCAQVRQALQ